MNAIQFEMWAECNVKCKFCYLSKDYNKTPDEIKHASLDYAINFFEQGEPNGYDTVGFIGGEFFQGQLSTPEIKEKFFYLMSLVHDWLQKKKIKEAWVSAALTQKTEDLERFLDMFKDIERGIDTGIWIPTSWDARYRFRKGHTEEAWRQNLLWIKREYPNIKRNATTILTGFLLKDYLEDRFRFYDFFEFTDHLFFKPPVCSVGDFSYSKKRINSIVSLFCPTRDSYLKFMYRVAETEPRRVWDTICNINYRADTLVRLQKHIVELREKGTKYEIASHRKSRCGHHYSYSAYIDSDGCMLCDKLLLEKQGVLL